MVNGCGESSWEVSSDLARTGSHLGRQGRQLTSSCHSGSWEQCSLLAIRMMLITTYFKGRRWHVANHSRNSHTVSLTLRTGMLWWTIIAVLCGKPISRLWKRRTWSSSGSEGKMSFPCLANGPGGRSFTFSATHSRLWKRWIW